jgi:hypothetical protein
LTRGLFVGESEEGVFGAAAGACAAAGVEGDGLFEDVEVVAAVGAGHGVAGGGFDVAAFVGGLVDDVGELVGGEGVGEVDEGAVDGGDGDVVVGGEIAEVEGAVAVDLAADQAGGEELQQGDQAVLAPGDCRNPRVRRGGVAVGLLY